jgi:predicted DsbA family dithiol-disulfide isomerase
MTQTAAGTLARIDIVSDAICPWCYIGKRQLERAIAMLDPAEITLDIHWRPYQLNPDMPAGGMPRTEYRARKFGAAKAVELDQRITQAAAAVGLGFRTDLMQRTPNTVDAHRLAWFAERSGTAMQDAVIEAMFRGYFIEGRDIGDRATLAELAEEAGLNRATVETFLAGTGGRAEVIEEDRAARASGLNGVPTFAMEGHILFSGAMPADTMAEALVSAWKVLGKRAA